MLRVSEFIKKAYEGREYRPLRGVILIWNLTNRCNLYCKHCYSSANQDRAEELSLEEIKKLSFQLAQEKVHFAILSGGEPLMREDIYQISEILKKQGIKTYLSTNGLLINEDNVEQIKRSFDYVGISIDGEPDVHDRFRGKKHAFEDSLNALMLCLQKGIKVGLRFTLTSLTQGSLPFILDLSKELQVDKLYISHLVYAGRGSKLSSVDKENYREKVREIIRHAFELHKRGLKPDIVTGNNEADAVILYEEFKKRFPEKANYMLNILRAWGGNQAGVRLVNIDHRGNVKPDPFFYHSLGNVRKKDFKAIWNSNGLLTRLREAPRRIEGKCSECPYLDICNGNSRARSFYATGSYFKEDPACYI